MLCKALRNKVLAYNARSPRAPIVRTADIAARVIKPETAGLPQGGRAYVQTDGGRHSGKPSYFVCHAWQSDAVGFLEAIIGHGVGVVRRGGASPVYYLDLACVDQHQTDQAAGTSSMPFETLSNDFVGLIQACGRMLVVPDVNNLVITDRMWCLFEVAMGTRLGLPILVVPPPSQVEKLLNKLMDLEGDEVLVSLMTSVDSQTAKTTVPADLDNLKKMIETKVEGGYPAVDAAFTRVLQEWVAEKLSQLMDTLSDNPEAQAIFAAQSGSIMHGGKAYAHAIKFHTKSIQLNVSVHGPDSEEVGTGYTGLGLVYYEQKDYPKAVEAHNRALQILINQLGPDHPDVGFAYFDLGTLHLNREDCLNAVRCLEKAERIFLEEFGREDENTASVQDWLADARAEL